MDSPVRGQHFPTGIILKVTRTKRGLKHHKHHLQKGVWTGLYNRYTMAVNIATLWSGAMWCSKRKAPDPYPGPTGDPWPRSIPMIHTSLHDPYPWSIPKNDRLYLFQVTLVYLSVGPDQTSYSICNSLIPYVRITAERSIPFIYLSHITSILKLCVCNYIYIYIYLDTHIYIYIHNL